MIRAMVLMTVALATSAQGAVRWEEYRVDGNVFQLGRITVPERRSGDGGRSIEIAFIRLPATTETPGPPIVFLNGGPGQAATPAVRSRFWLSQLDGLRTLADVILLDQRGTGQSRPLLSCRDQRPDPARLFTDERQAWASSITAVRACAQRLRGEGIDLGAYNTRESANDLEDLRRALGVKTIDLFGFSYGTHLGLAAIRQHPGSIRRAVLIGTEGPDHTWKLPSTGDVQLRKIALATNAPGFEPALRRVLRKAAAEPFRVEVSGGEKGKTITIPVGRSGLQRLLEADLGDSRDFVAFPTLIAELDRGETAMLTKFVQKRFDQAGGPVELMGRAMDCASSVTPERLARIRTEAAPALLGNAANAREEELCEAVGVAALDPSFREPVVSDVPVLFVSGTMDANTPPFQAEEVRWGFVNGAHVIVDGAGHEDL
ncbi:MAG TPA: alpha/beta hydrolase, partial [Thermoanaerobaculia bacterium]|nr:alpha/beta hydrolase [Thermoanaerobaculia bacterium]